MTKPRTARSTQPTPVFDITTRLMRDRATLRLVDPADPRQTLDAEITVLAPNAPAMKEAAKRCPITFDEHGNVTMTDDGFDDALLERAIAATVAWNLVEQGVALPCDAATVRRVYTAPETAWIGGQVKSKVLDTQRFFTPPATS